MPMKPKDKPKQQEAAEPKPETYDGSYFKDSIFLSPEQRAVFQEVLRRQSIQEHEERVARLRAQKRLK